MPFWKIHWWFSRPRLANLLPKEQRSVSEYGSRRNLSLGSSSHKLQTCAKTTTTLTTHWLPNHLANSRRDFSSRTKKKTSNKLMRQSQKKERRSFVFLLCSFVMFACEWLVFLEKKVRFCVFTNTRLHYRMVQINI